VGLARTKSSAGAAVHAVFGALEVDSAWLGQLGARVQETQDGLKGQVTEQAQQAATRVNRWVQQASGWLGPRGGARDKGAKQLPPPRDIEQKQKQQHQQKQDKRASGSEGPLGKGPDGAAAGAEAAAAADAANSSGTAASSNGKSRAGATKGTAGSGRGGFDMQQVFMSALGGLGLEAARWASGGSAGGTSPAQPLRSGWWDKVDGPKGVDDKGERRQSGAAAAAADASAAAPATTDGSGSSSTDPSAAPVAGAASGSGSTESSKQPPPATPSSSNGAAPPATSAAAAPPPKPDAVRLSSAMAAAAAAHRKETLRRQSAGSLSSFPLTSTLSSYPVSGLSDLIPELYSYAPRDRSGESDEEVEEEEGEGAVQQQQQQQPKGEGMEDSRGSAAGSSVLHSNKGGGVV